MLFPRREPPGTWCDVCVHQQTGNLPGAVLAPALSSGSDASRHHPPLPGPSAWSSLEPPGLPLGRSDEEQGVCAPGGAQSSPGPPPAPRNPPRNHVNSPFIATAQCVAWTSHYKQSTSILIIILQYFLECVTIFITVHLSLSI